MTQPNKSYKHLLELEGRILALEEEILQAPLVIDERGLFVMADGVTRVRYLPEITKLLKANGHQLLPTGKGK
jgi:hypothetical protein